MSETTFENAADFLPKFLDRALAGGVSDIHIERRDGAGQIRVRMDGVLRVWEKLNVNDVDLLLRRVKFLSGMDIGNEVKIQEGRFTHKYKNKEVDLRVSVLPTPAADDIVIRVLASAPEVMLIDEMGFDPELVKNLRRAVKSHTGLLLVTGPTGSGKTTTLYAAVQELNDGTRKIITVEDPIEYQVQGLTQLKIDMKKGLNYAAILKTILRHDPDVVLIGETRTLEAAEIAVEASMTGHMVMSTLHTNSAAATILRLINMGISPMDVANAVTAILAQRLMRKLCPHCKKEIPASDELKKLMGDKAPAKTCIPGKCEKCDNTGYKGRVPIAELLVMDDDYRDVVLANPNLNALNKAVKEKGTQTILQNALHHVAAGDLSLDDTLAAVGD